MRPDTVLSGLLRLDPAAPRVTYYDDTHEPTGGERIELSGKVLANWVAKAGNLLEQEFDAGPGSSICLDLPAEHWRTLYWALAVWGVGATVLQSPEDADVVISTQPAACASSGLLVTLAALARSAATPPPNGVLDEAAELATFADQFVPLDQASEHDPALVAGARTWTYADVVPAGRSSGQRELVRGSLPEVLRSALAVWAAGGGVLLCRGLPEAHLPARLATEGAVAATATGSES